MTGVTLLLDIKLRSYLLVEKFDILGQRFVSGSGKRIFQKRAFGRTEIKRATSIDLRTVEAENIFVLIWRDLNIKLIL